MGQQIVVAMFVGSDDHIAIFVGLHIGNLVQ